MTAIIPPGFLALPLPIIQLSLAAVLKCGQSFRWAGVPLKVDASLSQGHPTHEYRLCLQDRVICLRQSNDMLYYRTLFPTAQRSTPTLRKEEEETLTWIKDYFQLDLDLTELYEDWSKKDPVFMSLRHRFSGIRILRQDPWENLISFICSANNNIARITKMVQSLCTEFSPALVTSAPGVEDYIYHSFPPPSALAPSSVSTTLRKLGFGYRAEYIQKTAQMLLETHGTDSAVYEWLRSLRFKSTGEARAELLKLMGVGRKVADCILLMSLDKREVIPVDTHVHQIAIKYYGFKGTSGGKTPMTPKLYDSVNSKLGLLWGSHAGWAHTVLFTADLKAFATYGLGLGESKNSASPENNLAGSSTSQNKRRRTQEVVSDQATTFKILNQDTSVKSEISVEVLHTQPLPDGNLIDRVKRRRRNALPRS